MTECGGLYASGAEGIPASSRRVVEMYLQSRLVGGEHRRAAVEMVVTAN